MDTIIYCEWKDACAYSGWDSEENYNLCLIKSVGFLVKETKEKIVLAVSKSDGEFNAVMVIPKAWIVKKKTLEL